MVLAEAATFGAPTGDGLYRAQRIEAPVPDLGDEAAGLGQANLLTASDGVVRSIPLVVEDPGRALVPSVVLETSALLAGQSPVPTIRPDGVQVGSSFIPTDSRAALSISFAPELDANDPAAPYVSAADVLSGHIDRSLHGAVVLVGVVDPAAGDVHATPIGPTMPGVFVLANALNTMLTRSFIAPASRLPALAWVAVLALLAALLVQIAPPWAAAAGWIVLAGGYLVLAFLRFDQGRAMDLVYPPLGATLAFVGSMGERTVTEVRRRRRVSSLFAQYVPPPVARRLVEEPALVDAALRGERFDASLLFCDLRGFTALAGSMTPQQVRDMLEVFYEHTSRIVGEHQGTVIQYVGDEIYAAFGVPAPAPDHAAQAVACGIAFQRAGPAINDGLAEIGIPPIHYGVGIESGPVVAALVGNERRRQYSVNGDAVNVAARLCAGAPAGEIWITGDVLRQLDPAPPTDDLGIVPFKNVNREVRVHRIKLDPPV